jgi:hypothetical protein
VNLRVLGAGLPCTSAQSLKVALEHLLGGRCYHMREIPGYPFGVGGGWDRLLAGYVAAVAPYALECSLSRMLKKGLEKTNWAGTRLSVLNKDGISRKKRSDAGV